MLRRRETVQHLPSLVEVLVGESARPVEASEILQEPRRALDDGSDRRALKADEQVTFPVPGDRAVFDLGGAFAD